MSVSWCCKHIFRLFSKRFWRFLIIFSRRFIRLWCQIAKSQRYRFSLLVNELRNDSGVTSYLTSVLAFINCLIVSHDSINDRVRIRNELIGKYIGWSDVTESMVTIWSPFCGYNTIYCVELNGADWSYYSNKIESVSENVHVSTYLQSQAYLLQSQWQTFLRVFTYKMAAKMN